MLKTERLILRPFVETDFEDLFRHRSDERVMEYLGGVQSAETVEARIKFYAAHFEEHDFAMCAMLWKETGQFIGVGGLQFVEDKSDVEVGYTVDPEFWRRGIATECTIGCLMHGFEMIGLKRIIAQTHTDNLGSRIVMEHSGMKYLDHIDIHGEDWVRYVSYANSKK